VTGDDERCDFGLSKKRSAGGRKPMNESAKGDCKEKRGGFAKIKTKNQNAREERDKITKRSRK